MQRLIEQEFFILFYQLHLHSRILQMFFSKATYTAFNVHILTVHAFPGNQTHDHSIASIMLYCLSHRNLVVSWIVKSECCIECCCMQKDLNAIGITATLNISAERSELYRILIKDNNVITVSLQKALALQLY